MKRKLIFIQPVLASYRHPFFEELQKKFNVTVIYSKKDFLNVESVEVEQAVYTRINLNGFVSVFNKIFWQKGVKFSFFNKDDIVVVSGNPRVINHMFLIIYLRIRGIKVLWWGQGWTANSRGLLSKIRHKMMNLANGILVYTEKEAKQLIVSKPIAGLNNGLDLNSIIDLKYLKQAKVTNPESLNLFFIGRLTEKSKIKDIVEVILNINMDVTLSIIGDYTKFKMDFPELYKDSTIQRKVCWYGAIYDENKIASIASNCDYFIYGGAVGLSLIHAFSYYLPAIVHDQEQGHMPEYAAFVNSYNGFSFKKDDFEDLSRLLISLGGIDNSQLKINARNTVLKSFNTHDMADRCQALINKIL
ncbi:glycosyltransferase [Vibrio fluvialis]|nr:glycosyltransferase [Vibrio fluvialis]